MRPFALALALSAAAAPLAAAPDLKPIVEARLRFESFDAARVTAAQESSYELLLGRLRVGGEAAWGERLAFRGLLQAAAMDGVPSSAGFGSGPVYLSTNGGDRSPTQAGLLEAALTWRGPRVAATVGRQAFAEGVGPSTGVALLDGVAQRRLAERLVGNLDFPNVGRRFDGAVARFEAGGAGRLEAFALRPLAGAFHYDDAFDRLDIDLFGASLTSGYGAWLPNAQARLFAIGYRDDRAAARAATGGALDVDTFGGSLLVGDASWSALAWAAVQRGDWGALDHDAHALVAELGRRFAGVRGEPSLHLGYELASGDAPGGDHGAFFNLLPTNHKFYGALDYVAFSNVRDLYLEARWRAASKVSVSAAVHDFTLDERADAWYGGSGAMSERELGYAARRPAGGVFRAGELGRELDLAVAWTAAPELAVRLEAGLWRAGAAGDQFARADGDGGWAALELTWKPALAR